MRVWMLGSGSKGNALVLESGDSRIAIDAGFPLRVLAERLRTAGIAPQSIEGALLTHEHTDHVKGACAAGTRWGWSLHATAGTTLGTPGLADADVRTFEPGAVVRLGRFELRTIPTPHDAAAPVAVVATSTLDGSRAGIFYDLGCATDAVRHAMRDLDLLVLESNHDEGMLRAGPYPPSVQDRIAGRRGHLSNRVAASLAADCARPGLRQVILAHLSEKCNDARLAVGAVSDALRRTRFRGGLTAAPQHGVAGPFSTGGGEPRAEQLALAI